MNSRQGPDALPLSIAIDRDSPRPIHEQLRAAIEIAILSGDIPDGAPLPSIRRLADALGIAPNTVARVYRELADSEWVSASPKRGYYVEFGDGLDSGDAAESMIEALIDDALRAAIESGIDTGRFAQLVAARIKARERVVRRVAVLGYRRRNLEEHVEHIAAAIADLGVEVFPLAVDDLELGVVEAARLASIEALVVPVGDIATARRLLPTSTHLIVPMTRGLDPELGQAIANLPANTRFGIVTVPEETPDRPIAILRRWHPLHVVPATASCDDAQGLASVLHDADVIVLTARSRLHFPDARMLPKPSIVVLSVPDGKTLRMLRSRLASNGR